MANVQLSNKTHEYLLQQFEALASNCGTLKGLDYGCGYGEIVVEARKRGYDFWGAETFFEQADYETEAKAHIDDATRPYILSFHAGDPLPFADETFDFV